jgi:F-type H+-transporting ATPase subunit delta
MLTSRVAYRFAKALLQLAVEKKELDRIIEDMRLVNLTCRENRDLRVMLGSPVIKVDKKRRIFRKIFEGHLSKMSSTFFDIIFRRGREDLVLDISESFISQFKEFTKIQIVNVESATVLSGDNRKNLMEYVKSMTNETIELVEKVNPELIGGLIIRMNDLQIDSSVKSNLNKLEKEFSKDLYSAKL